MSFFKKLFGKKDQPPCPAPQVPPPLPTEADPSKDPNMIRVHDAYGRELFITRQQWRDNVLLGNIQKAWNQPDDLYQMIVGALNDGFRSDVIDAARHLYVIDPNHERGACIWGIVLMEENHLEKAEKVFRDFLAHHGETGAILTNLAKVQSSRGEAEKAEATLWQALEVDPNQDNGLAWYGAIYQERGGDASAQEAWLRVSKIPGSWRAQIWLARASLQRRDLPQALSYYRETLDRVSPVPADVLMQISGDLGNTGHLTELLEIVEPRFQPASHGLPVGNNLIKAHLDLGQFDAARAIINQLYALNRPDWKQALSYWENEIGKANIATSPQIEHGELEVAMLTIEGPVWMKPSSPAADLFPAKTSDVPSIAILGSSAETPSNSQRIERQLADARGRLSRAIPLFLAEQIEFLSSASSKTLVPWITNDTGGFVLAGKPWEVEQASFAARQGEKKSDYAVVIHLLTLAEPWTAHAQLIRTIDNHLIGEVEATISSQSPGSDVQDLTQRALTLLEKEGILTRQPKPSDYQPPAGNDASDYLLRLEQLLAVRCEAMMVAQGRGGTLSGEHAILDGNLTLCVNHPASLPARVLMAQTFLAMKASRPEILASFKNRTDLLQREHPLPEPAQSVVQRLFDEAFSAT